MGDAMGEAGFDWELRPPKRLAPQLFEINTSDGVERFLES